jgi:SAM-dependent methyltransferase
VSGRAEPPETDYDEIYRTAPVIPWDLGEPQPALAELVRSGWCRGDVLDVGCGPGELTLAVAARGHAVLGVDVSARAVQIAAGRAAERGLAATFVQGDATELAGFVDRFDTVLDSGLLHSLRPVDQVRAVTAIRRAGRAGARIAVLCFADRPGARTPGRGLTEDRLRELFGAWRIEELAPAPILGVVRPGYGEVSEWPRDAAGRTPMDGWLLQAHLS